MMRDTVGPRVPPPRRPSLVRATIAVIASLHAALVFGASVWLVVRTCDNPHQCAWAVYAIGPILFGLLIVWGVAWFLRAGGVALLVVTEVLLLTFLAGDWEDPRYLALSISVIVVLVLIALPGRDADRR